MNREFSNPDHEFKAPEQLQAQTEVFADQNIKDFSDDQKLFLKYSAELSSITDLNNLPEDLAPELVDAIQRNKRDYVNFLRQEKQAEINFAKENIEKYKAKFQPFVEDLKTRMAGLERNEYNQLPEFLGSGSNGSAFKAEIDGKSYAVKFSSSITQSNFLYDPKEGFSVLDFHLKQNANSKYTLAQSMMSLKNFLSSRKTDYPNYDSPNYEAEAYERKVAFYKVFLPSTIRLIKILKDKYPKAIEDWKAYEEEVNNDLSRSMSPVIRRDDIQVIEEFKPYLEELKQLGF